MQVTLALWGASAREAWRAYHATPQLRVALAALILIQGGLGVWLARQLAGALTGWQLQGEAMLARHLWQLCLQLWGLAVAVALPGTIQRCRSGADQLLLATLPIRPADQLRGVYGQVVLVDSGSWLLLSGGVLGYGLLARLGWAGLPWLALALAGVGVGGWCGVVAGLLVLSAAAPRSQLVGLAPALLLVSALIGIGGTIWWSARPLALGGAGMALLGSGAIVALWVLLVGPLAARLGPLPTLAVVRTHGRSQGGTVGVAPGLRWLDARLLAARGLTAALLRRGLLSQSRNPLFWVRLLALGLYSAATPLVFQWLADRHLPTPLLLVGASSTLVVLTIADCASSPFGSEGARLSLYLTAPVRPEALVWAKLVALTAPALALAYGAIVVPAWWLGASLGDLVVSGLLVTPLVLGVVALVVGGSVADSNLDLVIEGPLQQLIDEESPLTPQRPVLVGAAALLTAAQLTILWYLSPLVALGVFAILNGLVVVGMEHTAPRLLRRLPR